MPDRVPLTVYKNICSEYRLEVSKSQRTEEFQTDKQLLANQTVTVVDSSDVLITTDYNSRTALWKIEK